jgi:hypothetical protein
MMEPGAETSTGARRAPKEPAHARVTQREQALFRKAKVPFGQQVAWVAAKRALRPYEYREVSPADIAQEAGVSESTAKRMLKLMEWNGCVAIIRTAGGREKCLMKYSEVPDTFEFPGHLRRVFVPKGEARPPRKPAGVAPASVDAAAAELARAAAAPRRTAAEREWERVSVELRAHIGESEWSIWFADTVRAVAIQRGVLVLEATSVYYADHIRSSFRLPDNVAVRAPGEGPPDATPEAAAATIADEAVLMVEAFHEALGLTRSAGAAELQIARGLVEQHGVAQAWTYLGIAFKRLCAEMRQKPGMPVYSFWMLVSHFRRMRVALPHIPPSRREREEAATA